MKPFKLVFKTEFSPGQLKAFLEQNHGNCDTCPSQFTCKLKENVDESAEDMFLIEQILADSYSEISLVIPTIVNNPNITLVLLIDDKDKCYVYKSEGNFTQVKQQILPEFIESFRDASGEIMRFSAINDLRGVVSLSSHHNVEAN